GLGGGDAGGNAVRGGGGAGQVLPAGGHVFRHRHDACDMYGWDAGAPELGVARQRQRTADETRDLGEPPARPARPRFQDLAGIDDCLPAGEALAEAAADRELDREPFRFRHQRAEAEVTQYRTWFGSGLGLDWASEDFGGNCGRTHRAPPGVTISAW